MSGGEVMSGHPVNVNVLYVNLNRTRAEGSGPKHVAIRGTEGYCP